MTEPNTIVRTKNICIQCGFAMTWAERRRQYGRLIRKGLSPQEADAIMPRCQKCITASFDRTNETAQPGQSSQ